MSETEIAAFQTEIMNKIQFKSSSRVSLDAILFKAFKFFDLYNNGYLSRTDFFKAIAKCGVVVDTHNIASIYQHYDPQNTGKIDYSNFIEKLLSSGKSETSSAMNQSQVSQGSRNRVENSPYRNVPDQEQPERGDDLSQSQKHSNHSPSQQLRESQYSPSKPFENLNTLEDVFQRIKIQIRGDGVSGLLNFANRLKATDIDRTHLISKEKLGTVLTYIKEPALSLLVNNYDPNKFNEINYAELIYGLKGNMDLQRQSLVDDLFNMLDHQQKGEISIQEIISAYRNRSEIGSFKRSIDSYCRFQKIEDGIFTDEDFNDFFEFVSFSFNEFQSFQEFIKVGFYGHETVRSASRGSSRREFDAKRQSRNRPSEEEGIKPPKDQLEKQMTGDFRKLKLEEDSQKSQEPQRNRKDHQNYEEEREKQSNDSRSRHSDHSRSRALSTNHVQEVNMILLRMRRTLAHKGTRGFLLFQKLLKKADTNQDDALTLQQFKNVIKEQKVDITNVEATNLFGVFDEHKKGCIDYIDFLNTLKGETPQSRVDLIQRMWERAKIDEQHTNLPTLKSILNFRSHPDVQNGRKYDEQIWKEIIDTIMLIQDLNGSPRSEEIAKDVFSEYCENLSLSIAEDSLFESVAQNFWKIGSVVKIEDQYAGSRKIFDPSKKGYLQDHHRNAYNGGTVSQNAPFGTFNTPTSYTTEHNRL